MKTEFKNILLISNHSSYATLRLVEEAEKQGCKLTVLSVLDLKNVSFEIDFKDFDVLYIRDPYLKQSAEYLPEIIKLAKKFKNEGKKVVDLVIAEGSLGEGKLSDYIKLKNSGILIPETQELTNSQNLQFPVILKWNYGLKGKNVFFVKDIFGIKRVLEKYPQNEIMVQEFIPAEFEYKVITIGYKALPVVLKFGISPKTFRPDFNNFEVLNSGQAKIVADLGQRAARVLGRELSKIDILESLGKYYVLEANRFPGLKSFENLTGFNVAGEFVRYLQN